MKVEPTRIDSAIKRPSSLRSVVATQENNWLQNEIVQTSAATAIRVPSSSVKSLRLQSAVVQTQPKPLKIHDVVPVQHLVPPGLEYLASVDQLLVQQKVELIEAITGGINQRYFQVFLFFTFFTQNTPTRNSHISGGFYMISIRTRTNYDYRHRYFSHHKLFFFLKTQWRILLFQEFLVYHLQIKLNTK